MKTLTWQAFSLSSVCFWQQRSGQKEAPYQPFPNILWSVHERTRLSNELYCWTTRYYVCMSDKNFKQLEQIIVHSCSHLYTCFGSSIADYKGCPAAAWIAPWGFSTLSVKFLYQTSLYAEKLIIIFTWFVIWERK